MAEIDRGERETAERDTYFKDTVTNKTYQRVRDQDAINILEDIATNTGGSSSSFDTLQFEGSVDTTPVNLPSTAAGEISQIIFSCRVQTPSTKRLLFSLDGGTTYFTLSPGSMVAWEPKDIEQVQVKGNTSGVLYDIIINRRAP